MQKYKYYLEMFGANQEEVEVPDNLIIQLDKKDENGFPLCFHLEYVELGDIGLGYGVAVEGVHPDYLDPSEENTVEITFSRFVGIAGARMADVPEKYLPDYHVNYYMHRSSDDAKEEDKHNFLHVFMGKPNDLGYIKAYNVAEGSIHEVFILNVPDYFEIPLGHYERRSNGKVVPTEILEKYAKLG